MAYDYYGQTANIIYDKASNSVITIHPGGSRHSTSAGNDAAAAVAKAKANIEKSYTNVGSINVTQEEGAFDRLAAETKAANDAARAERIAAGPPAEVNTYDGTSTYTGGTIPKGRTPSVKEIMDIGGVDFNTASELVTTGSNTDTRDWNSIMNSGLVGQDLVDNIRAATNKMYGGVTVRNGPSGMAFYAGNGVALSTITNGMSIEKIRDKALKYGVTDDWYNTDWQGQSDSYVASLQPAIAEQQYIISNPNSTEEQVSAATQQITKLQNQVEGSKATAAKMIETSSYGADWLSPYTGWENTANINLINGLSESTLGPTPGQTLSGTAAGTETTQVGTEGTMVTGNQNAQQQPTTGNDAVSMAANEAIMTPQDLPQTVSYQMPQKYTGSGYTPGGTGMGTTTMAPMTGTFTKPADSGMLGGQQSQQYTLGQTGTQTPQVAQPQQAEVRMYRNNAGMTTSITFINGQPQTPIPSGFYPVGSQPAGQTPYTPLAPQVQTPTVQTPVQTQAPNVNVPTVQPVTGYMPQFNMNQGGIVPSGPMTSTPMFGGFKPEAMQRIANGLGYSGDMSGFDQYLNSNPDKQQKMNGYMESARKMAEGGVVQKFAPGGDVQSTTVDIQQYDPRVLNQQYIPQQTNFSGQDITQVQAGLAKTPGLPTGATVVPTGTQLTAGQLVSPYSGQVAGSLALPTALAATEQATMPMTGQAALTSPVEAAGAVRTSVDQTQAAQLQQVAGIAAAQQETTSVSNLQAAQGTGILMDNPTQRQIQDGELISAAANAQTAAAFNEQIQAATAEPSTKATVQGQLEGLMAQFEGGETPAWAAGSMRNAMATLSARGLGASSLAGQAVIQAAMESALPIAQMDAQVQAQFEGQNLSNRQQRAMLAAQQRAQFLGQEFDQAFQSRVANAAKISDIANMNFTAEQQVALENSRIANTMELTNLSNSQAMVLAEASALANLDMQNLNNRQQASVQNAQNFLQADLTNLSNQQQTELFKAQQRVQSLFTDQAAINAAQQFNASSQNQVDQFYSSLQSNTAQFNASQANAQGQFNAGQVNVIERFNAEINNQRDQFNAQNRLIIDQSNAQWRREIATADTASVNRANEVNAQALLGYSQQAYNNLWQYYGDNMEWAWTSAENERQRYMNLTMAKMQQDTSLTLAKAKEDYETSNSFGGLVGKILTSDLGGTLTGTLLDTFNPFK